MMKKFAFGNANVKGVYYDEENRRHLNTIRMQYAQVAMNLADHDRKDDAKKMLEKCDKMILQENFPYGLVSRRQQQDQISGQFLLAAYKAGDTYWQKKYLNLCVKIWNNKLPISTASMKINNRLLLTKIRLFNNYYSSYRVWNNILKATLS